MLFCQLCQRAHCVADRCRFDAERGDNGFIKIRANGAYALRVRALGRWQVDSRVNTSREAKEKYGAMDCLFHVSNVANDTAQTRA